MTERVIRPLAEVLATVPDPRQARGKRHPLRAILLLAGVAMLCRCDSLLAIAEWGRDQGAAGAARLGFRCARTPCVATLHRVFRRLAVVAFERTIGEWADSVVAALGTDEGDEMAGATVPLPAIAVDGKTLRGSHTPEVPAVHLLSALSQQLRVVLAQVAVGEKTNEIPAFQSLVEDLVLAGRLVTVDALLCQREVATTILQKGGTP
jgi:hypothetical protein